MSKHTRDTRQPYLAAVEKAAYAHLETLSCCPTLKDAIAHVTRNAVGTDYKWKHEKSAIKRYESAIRKAQK